LPDGGIVASDTPLGDPSPGAPVRRATGEWRPALRHHEQGNGSCRRSQGIHDGRRHGGGLVLQLQRQGHQVNRRPGWSGRFRPRNSAGPTGPMPTTLARQHHVPHACPDEAPRTPAATKRRESKRLKMANMISRPNGSVHVRCAPGAEVTAASWRWHSFRGPVGAACSIGNQKTKCRVARFLGKLDAGSGCRQDGRARSCA
jgi:hypothetical protein